MWILYATFANITVLSLEYVYRSNSYFESFLESIPYTIIPILFAQWALFMLFKTAPTYLMGWAVFAVGNAILRIIPNYFLGEALTVYLITGIMVMLGGMFLIKLG